MKLQEKKERLKKKGADPVSVKWTEVSFVMVMEEIS